MSHEPVFVVVGYVNRGKSSVVSTLAADDSVLIDPYPGTTTRNESFPMRVGDQTLYTLVDTPGFERPREMLEWLQSRTTAASERRPAVEEFVRRHSGSERFRHECELLRPVLAGGAILYVVDGSVPHKPHHEAEMEILRWTGQPRMAVINRIRSADHGPEWRAVLSQHFNLVRDFDAHRATFALRVELLQTLGELREDWKAVLRRAVDVLTEDRRRKARESARAISQLIVDALTLVLEKRLAADVDPDPVKEKLAAKYYETLRGLEGESRSGILQIYRHRKLVVNEAGIGAVQEDLFNLGTWSKLGLTKGQITSAAAVSGAVSGAVIDALLGGHSLGLAAAAGGVGGGAAAWLSWDRLERVRVMGRVPLVGRRLRIGPMTNRRFPWVLLDRALLFHEVVSNRAHAKRDAVDLSASDGEKAGRVSELSPQVRAGLEGCFGRLRRLPSAEAIVEIREKIEEALIGMLGDTVRS